MKDNNVTFMTVFPDGRTDNMRVIKQSDIGKCPHFIMVADHYRPNGSCRCNDHTHKAMAKWGYKWRDGQWR